MYSFKFLRLPTEQRRQLLAANEFEAIPLHKAVKRQLAIAASNAPIELTQIRSKISLFVWVLRSLSDLVAEILLWSLANALVVLSATLLARELFQARATLWTGVGLVLSYFLLKVAQITIEYRNACRRLQIHRGIQITLYHVINQKLVRISPAGRQKFSKGQLKTLIGSDVEAIEDFISAALQQWTPALVSVFVAIPAIWLLSGANGLISLAVGLLLIPFASFGMFGMELVQGAVQRRQDALITAVGEWVKNIRLVRFLGWSEAIESEINRRASSYVNFAALRHGVGTLVWAISHSWSVVPLVTLIFVARARGVHLSVVELFSSFWLIEHVMLSIQYIPWSFSLLGAASAGAGRVRELLQQPELADEMERCDRSMDGTPAPCIAEHVVPVAITVRGLQHQFSTRMALDGISTTFDLTQRTAIVGSVGSGKTTLLEILLGELPASRGDVSVTFSDGSSGPLWRSDVYHSFRSHVGYSPQQPFLSNGSMRLNIDLSGSASEQSVSQAIDMAELASDLALFSRGLDEEVGESGINLSGGQRQRVSLARVFISKRPVMFLDDPLSAVDHATERALITTIVDASQGLLLVSHRLAELERCDRVVVLDSGRIVEDGNPTRLASDPDSRFSGYLRAVEEHGD
jgi:ATP-binding cassette subfamily B tetracycline resistance protein